MISTARGRCLDWMFPDNNSDIDPTLGENASLPTIGLIFLATLPLVTRGLTLLHDVIARGMLSAVAFPTHSAARWHRSAPHVAQRCSPKTSRCAVWSATSTTARSSASSTADGPRECRTQDRCRPGCSQSAARGGPRTQARDTLEELRALSRGFAPPILQDRGLIAGLESLAARSTIPVSLEMQLDPAIRLAPEIERSAYFVVAELYDAAST